MKTLTTLIACCFVLIATAQISSTEKQALIDFFNSTNGAEWNTPWDLNQPVSTWDGVEIKNNKVVGIEMGFNNLQGEIPASIGNLKYLETLKLFFNHIGGSLPVEITNLKNLITLDLTSNALSGTIPSEIGEMTQLEVLLLSSNNFTGTIPSEMGNLKNLSNLVVFDNHFFGEFPVAISQLDNLKELIVADNNFNFESLQTSVAVLHKKGVKIDFNELNQFNINTELATLVIDDEE
jgi:hypothetical protein